MTAPATIGIPVARPRRRGAELRLLFVALPRRGRRAGRRRTRRRGPRRDLDHLVRPWSSPPCSASATLAIRRWAPYADPTLLPLCGILLGVGTAMIHRLDLGLQLANPGEKVSADASLQLVWVGIGMALFVAVLAALPDHRVLSRYGYTAGLGGHRDPAAAERAAREPLGDQR